METKIIMIYVAFLGTGNTGTFDIYSDSDNYTTPFEVNILKSEIENGFTSYNCPDDATEVRVLGDNLSCGLQPIIPISIADNQVFGMTGNTLIETDINTLCLNNSTNYKIMKGGYTPYLIVKKSNFIKTGVTTSGTFYDGLYSITYPYNSYNTCIKFGDSDLGIDLIDYIMTACGYAPNPIPTPTPTPTPTITPTPTVTPTPTPTVTPTPTPVPLTGYTNGFYILVNDRSDSYPSTGTTWFSLATGTTYNGTLNNGPVWSGGTPGFFTFDGTNDWVDFGAASSGSTTGSFTWGGWVKTTTSATQKVFMMRGNDASSSGWSLFLTKENDNKFQAGVVTTTPGIVQTSATSTTTMSNDTWYYLVGVWTAGSSINIYVNGVLETTTATTRTNLRTSGIGWNLMRGNGSDYTNGSLSEFIVYQSVVSGANILNNFNANKSKYGY